MLCLARCFPGWRWSTKLKSWEVGMGRPLKKLSFQTVVNCLYNYCFHLLLYNKIVTMYPVIIMYYELRDESDNFGSLSYGVQQKLGKGLT